MINTSDKARRGGQNMRQLWMRAGINLNLSAEEADAILAPGASAETIEMAVKKIILKGRYSFSGESYIPQPCVEQFNDAYGTEYKADDIDFEVNLEAIPMPREDTKIMLTTPDLQALQQTAYERFKLNWMTQHGYTAADLLAKYSDYWGEVESDEEGMYDFWQYLEDTGFNGEIWPCLSEFLKVEFRDVSLMYQLLNNEEFSMYLLHIKEIFNGTSA